MVTWMTVPRWGLPLSWKVPPSNSARSRMPRSPRCPLAWASVTRAGVKEQPSSPISRTICPSFRARLIQARSAPECSSTFCRASWVRRKRWVRSSVPKKLTVSGWRWRSRVRLVRWRKSSACFLRAAAKPKWSRRAGRSSRARVRTSDVAPSRCSRRS